MKVMLWEWRTPDVVPIACDRCGKRELSSIAARMGWTFTTDDSGNTTFICHDCRTDCMSVATIEGSTDSLGAVAGVVKGGSR